MTSMLRVLHVIGGGEFGGAEQHILNLLASFPKDEVTAGVVCFYDTVFARKLREAGIPVTPLAQYGRFDVRLLAGLRTVLDEFKPDIVHSHGVKANFLARLAARHRAGSILTTVHSYRRYDYPNPLAYWVASLLERSTRRWNDHYIAVSQAIRAILHQEGIADERISLIYNGIHLSPFRRNDMRQPDRQRLWAEWSIPADAFVFGTVARFVPVKGLTYMLEAFATVAAQDQGRAYRLVLVGDGPERPLLEQTAERLGIREAVVFTGFRQDIPACLHAFDAFVISSLHEGLPYTILEAMASEVPVIATAVGGLKEFIQPGRTGLAVSPGSARELAEAMRMAAADPHLRSQLTKEALRQVEENYTIERMAARTLELYRSLRLHKEKMESETT